MAVSLNSSFHTSHTPKLLRAQRAPLVSRHASHDSRSHTTRSQLDEKQKGGLRTLTKAEKVRASVRAPADPDFGRLPSGVVCSAAEFVVRVLRPISRSLPTRARLQDSAFVPDGSTIRVRTAFYRWSRDLCYSWSGAGPKYSHPPHNHAPRTPRPVPQLVSAYNDITKPGLELVGPKTVRRQHLAS